MSIEKKALLGFHNPSSFHIFGWGLREKGYSIDEALTPKEMLEKTREDRYDFYLMDVNLGKMGGEDISTARQVYNLIKERVQKGEAKFFAVSHTSNAIILAIEQGIPAINKTDFDLKFDEYISE